MQQTHLGIRFITGVVLAVLGSLMTFGGYLLVLLTTCFTFRFERPVYSGFKKRLWVANLLLPVVMIVALAGVVDTALVLGAGFASLGSPPWWATVIPALVLGNLFTSVFGIWSPVEARLIRKRLQALGISLQQLRAGIYLGISDPARSDWRKMVLEDDVGMLWLERGRLTYRGDVDEFSIAPDELTHIERVVVGSSLAAHLGLRHIVLHLNEGDRRVRLHVEDCFTPSGQRRTTDHLAARLAAWKRAGAAAPRVAASA